ncbi:hypothetical protein IKF15_00075 [Candidatus Saccharibacteria bacterium]|nr:hypothetical protein [Candidatus Saccharibacteria bacterium]
MAKQSGIHGIRGKINGVSYYSSKNGGQLIRKINEGMSSRVKTAKEYANTRLNNAEFGAAGSLAGAIVRPISQRWRFILDSIATGKLVKAIKAAMMQDTASPWGERVVPLTEMAHLQEVFNGFSKNEMPQEIVDVLQKGVTYKASDNTLNFGQTGIMSDDLAQQLLDKGATHFNTKVFAFNVSKPYIGADGKTYVPAESLMVDISTTFGVDHGDIAQKDDFFDASELSNSPAVLNEEAHLGGVLVVFLPERKVGNEYYTLQELCSAYWCPAKAA